MEYVGFHLGNRHFGEKYPFPAGQSGDASQKAKSRSETPSRSVFMAPQK